MYQLLNVPNLISIFLSLVGLSKESIIYILDLLQHFMRNLFFTVSSSMPNPKAGAPPLVDYPQLLMEAMSSIHNLRTRHAGVTRGPLEMGVQYNEIILIYSRFRLIVPPVDSGSHE
jgi:hypothetical protein